MKVVVLIHVMGGVLHAEILVQEIVQDVAHVQDVMDVKVHVVQHVKVLVLGHVVHLVVDVLAHVVEDVIADVVLVVKTDVLEVVTKNNKKEKEMIRYGL